jgi:hypothetical protein
LRCVDLPKPWAQPVALLRLAIASLLLWGGLVHAAAPGYVLEGTEVHTLRMESSGRDYDLYISLPASYGKSGGQSYPVVFVTDAPYAFPIVRNIGSFVSRHEGNLSEFILVGLGYAKGDTPVQSRNRDYTPTDRKKGKTSPADGVYGGAEAYRRFVASQVFPFVARTYRADMHRKVLIGHSYGGLFGLHTLLTDPAMFDHYVLGSPSLWFGERHMFGVESAYAARKQDLPAHVLLMIGAYEAMRPQSRDPRYSQEGDMVRDVQAFERQLKSHRYPGLTVRSEVVNGEDHATVYPIIATHGLLWALPAK